MKITWDNIDDFYLTPKGNFRKHERVGTLSLIECCECCNEPFFYPKSELKKENKGRFCSHNCMVKGKNNPNYGRTGDKHHCYGRIGDKHPLYGKTGQDAANWKGGYFSKGYPPYDTYIDKLLPYGIECRRSINDGGILEVRCWNINCDKWFVPSIQEVCTKVKSIKGKMTGENNIYCSKECKKSCITFRQKKWRKGENTNFDREVQPELRKLVLERDNWTCQKCGVTEELHCHHIDPVVDNPIESADVDNCITYCKDCHKESHQKDGCRYGELRNCV